MPNVAAAATLLADATRARMLGALMDGRALTATELALEGEVTPATASSHLSRLTDAGLLAIARQGRHRYFRIASSEVARAIEALMTIAPPRAKSGARAPREGDAVRRARVCYDHLAGEAGVLLLTRLRGRRFVGGSEEAMALTRTGEEWCRRVGIDVEALRAARRPVCRACLDWSERRTHLAGSLGAAILDRLFAMRYAWRERGGRAVFLSPRGEAFVEHPELVPRAMGAGAPPSARAQRR